MNEKVYEQFASVLVKKRGVDPKGEAGKKIVAGLAEAAEDKVYTALIKSMTDEQLDKFDEVLDNDGDVNEFFVMEGIPVRNIIEKSLTETRKTFMKGVE